MAKNQQAYSAQRIEPKSIEKVRQLIRLATDPGTTEQERRSAAVMACELIRKNGFHIVLDPPPPPPSLPRANGRWTETWPKDYGAEELAARCGTCLHCKKQYVPYDRVRPTFFGYVHSSCLKAWLQSPRSF